MPQAPPSLRQNLLKNALKGLLMFVGGALVLSGLTYAGYVIRRPERSPQTQTLFKGVNYTREIRDVPRPLVIHTVTIDLTAPGIDFLVTPQGHDPGGKDTLADTVPGFLKKNGVQIAINGSFFYPMHVHHPLDYAPRVGEGVNVTGLSISNGNRYSAVEKNWAALCITSPQKISIEDDGDCPAGTVHGLAGDRQFIKNGQMLTDQDHDDLYPRTIVALDKAQKTMWLMIVDGRQKGYSEGMTLAEVADVLIDLGADEAVNLDGGGSTTLAIEEAGKPKVLNSPIQARLPTNLRPVANHLGIHATE